MKKLLPKQRYDAIDGLRAYAALGIALMHIKSNGGYNVPGFISNRIIGSMGEFVFLFMIISGFSMCCGYYEKLINNQISLELFYKKRYAKIWPYFTLLCLIDVVMSPSLCSLKELFADLTLCFGLLPNANISVIGVGWFIGLCFAFYLIFPFFCFLISNKFRAWFSLLISIIFNLLCKNYFFNSSHVVLNYDMRSNIIYSFVFFLAGGMIYLYRQYLSEISTRFRYIIFIICVIFTGIYFIIGKNVFTLLAMFSLFLIYAIGDFKCRSILKNNITRFLSSISMEIYLSHMMFFRIIEKLDLSHLFNNDLLSYVFTYILTLIGTICFAVIIKKVLKKIKERI